MRLKMRATVQCTSEEVWAFPIHDEKHNCYVQVLLAYKQRHLRIAKTCLGKGIKIELYLAENFEISKIKIIQYKEIKSPTTRTYEDIEEILLSSTGLIQHIKACNGKELPLPAEGRIFFKEFARTLMFSAIDILPNIGNFSVKENDLGRTRPMNFWRP